jgi:hypothetical protein
MSSLSVNRMADWFSLALLGVINFTQRTRDYAIHPFQTHFMITLLPDVISRLASALDTQGIGSLFSNEDNEVLTDSQLARRLAAHIFSSKVMYRPRKYSSWICFISSGLMV